MDKSYCPHCWLFLALLYHSTQPSKTVVKTVESLCFQRTYKLVTIAFLRHLSHNFRLQRRLAANPQEFFFFPLFSVIDNMLSMMEKYTNNLETIVNERTRQLQHEKNKTDELLHKMLPR